MPERDEAPPASRAGRIALGAALDVNRLGYGAMRLTGPGVWGEPVDRGEAARVLRRALDLGVDFIDTANSYGPEVNERLIREVLHPYPRGLVIATKGGLVRPGPGQWVPEGRPAALRAACESSLARLGVERIDLYQLHSPDRQVPYADSVGELARLQAEGKIREIGLSNVNLAQLKEARRLVTVVSVQNRYSVADRSSDDVLDACERLGIAFIPWFPLEAGAIGRAGGATPAHAALHAVAGAHGCSITRVAIAWLLARSAVMLPIPGTSSVAHLEENVAAAALRLGEGEMATLLSVR
ncbi:MAG: oxidoreductase [Gammaproteobacteria bacterium]|nr:oxidoreductase [Gammaproteobacteria bacterium]